MSAIDPRAPSMDTALASMEYTQPDTDTSVSTIMTSSLGPERRYSMLPQHNIAAPLMRGSGSRMGWDYAGT
jgi:hypothetical protein